MDPSEGDPCRAEKRREKYRILVVDDDVSVVKLLCANLRSEGHDCRGCHSGLEALKLISLERFDAIISDFHMPGMNGLELLRLVRKRHPHVAFIMATGASDARLGVQAVKEGADDYLLKPLDLEAMTVALGRTSERKRLEIQKENYRDNLEKTVDERTRKL